MKLFIPLMIFLSVFSLLFGSISYFTVSQGNFAATAEDLVRQNPSGEMVEGPLSDALIQIEAHQTEN